MGCDLNARTTKDRILITKYYIRKSIIITNFNYLLGKLMKKSIFIAIFVVLTATTLCSLAFVSAGYFRSPINCQEVKQSYLSDINDEIRASCVDKDGNIYLTGSGGVGSPITSDRYAGYNNSPDVIILKMDSSATEVLYCCLIGGSGSDMGNGIAVDDAGCIYVTGGTTSLDFPDISCSTGEHGGNDGFILKIDPFRDELVFSYVIGGVDFESSHAIALGDENVFITGCVVSQEFPTTIGDNKKESNGMDVFIQCYNPNGCLLFSRILGGLGNDTGHSIAVDSRGRVVVCGLTWSSYLGSDAALSGQLNGECDGFISTILPNGIFEKTCLLGSSQFDDLFGMCIDDSDNIYVTGQSFGDFPGPKGDLSTPNKGNGDVIIVKLSEKLDIIFSY